MSSIKIVNISNINAVKIINATQLFVIQNQKFASKIFNHIYNNLCVFSESIDRCDIMTHSIDKQSIILIIKQKKWIYCCKYVFDNNFDNCRVYISNTQIHNIQKSVVLNDLKYTFLGEQTIGDFNITEQTTKLQASLLFLDQFVLIY